LAFQPIFWAEFSFHSTDAYYWRSCC